MCLSCNGEGLQKNQTAINKSDLITSPSERRRAFTKTAGLPLTKQAFLPHALHFVEQPSLPPLTVISHSPTFNTGMCWRSPYTATLSAANVLACCVRHFFPTAPPPCVDLRFRAPNPKPSWHHTKRTALARTRRRLLLTVPVCFAFLRLFPVALRDVHPHAA